MSTGGLNKNFLMIVDCLNPGPGALRRSRVAESSSLFVFVLAVLAAMGAECAPLPAKQKRTETRIHHLPELANP